MGKRRAKAKKSLRSQYSPVANDVMGKAKKLLGFDRVLVNCQDGRETSFWSLHGISNPTSEATSYGDTKEIKPNG